MSKCYICDKKSKTGNTVSHSKRATKRIFSPNLQKINFIVDGKKLKEYVCTTCIKSGRIEKF